jgi:hypothetical protein
MDLMGKKCVSAVRIDPALGRSGDECFSHYTTEDTRPAVKKQSLLVYRSFGAAKRQNFILNPSAGLPNFIRSSFVRKSVENFKCYD